MNKISAQRLCVNSDHKNAHSAWSTYGLGLQDSNGAVKADLIDLDISLPHVDFAVDYSLHRKTDEELVSSFPLPPSAEVTVHNRTCAELFGYCKQCQYHTLAQSFAKTLANTVVGKKINCGALIKLRPNSESSRGSTNPMPEPCFFLGALCKKPLKHILAKAWLCETSDPANGNVFSLVGDSGVPTFQTSQQVFYDLVQECGADMHSITAWIFNSSFQSGPWGLHKLRVLTFGTPSSFVMKTGAAHDANLSRKEQVKLPFGLKMEKQPRVTRKRQPRAATVGGPAKKPKPVPPAVAIHHSDSDSDSSSSSSSSDSSGCPRSVEAQNSEPDSSPEIEQSQGRAESEPVPPNATGDAEMEAVGKACKEYQADVEQKAQFAEVASQRMGSFFNRSIGFDGASVAPTSRSICYHCNKHIEKGSLRMVYYWHTKRPSRFMHGRCVVQFVQSENTSTCRAQAVDAIRNVIESCGQEFVKDGAAKILKDLLETDCQP